MAKKSRKNRYDKNEQNVHSMFESRQWHPLDDEIDKQRDKKYVKNVKPRSEGQKTLMDAIKNYNLAMAIGPAGTENISGDHRRSKR